MTAALRRNACPSLAAPMRTGDGLLVRLNTLSSGLTPDQLRRLANSACDNGNGVIEVTARGSLQVRGLNEAGVDALARDIDAAGIAVRTGLPVETGPLAGIDANEIADPRPLADAITAAADEAGLAARLGPKVSVVVDGGGQWRLDAVAADIRCVAVSADDVVAWQVSLAGDADTAQPLGLFDVAGACDAAVMTLRAIAELGRGARARDLPRDVVDRLAGGCLRRPLRVQSAACPASHPRPGLLDVGAGQTALALALPFGSVLATSLAGLASKAERLNVREIRPVQGRALIVLGLDADSCEQFQREAAALGFVVSPEDPLTRISACPGAPACGSGHFETRIAAQLIARDAHDLLEAASSLHVSGCAKGCAHPAPARITLVGDENGVGIVVNGTAGDRPLAYCQPAALVEGFNRVARLARTQRRPDETTAAALSRLSPDSLAAAFRQE